MGKELMSTVQRTAWMVTLIMSVAIGMATVAFYSIYVHKRSQRIEAITQQLQRVAHERELELLNYLDDQEVKVLDLASSDAAITALEQLNAGGKSDALSKQKDFFEQHQKMYGYKDIFLISAAANISFSLKNKKVLGINLNKPPYSTTSLAQSFNRAVMTVSVDVSDFDFFKPLDQSALFFCVPVFKNQKLIGVLAAQIDDQMFVTIASNYRDLGRTGEMLLVEKENHTIHMILPTRNELTASPLFPKNSAFEKAVLGMRGSGIVPDYRQQSTLSVWRYLPDVAWGLVIQMDLNEAVAPVAVYYTVAILTFIFSLMMVLVAALLRMWNTVIATVKNQRRMRTVTICVFLIAIGVVAAVLYKYWAFKVQVTQTMRQEAQLKVEQALQSIMTKLEKAESVAQAVADDLGAGRLKKEDIDIRMKRDMQEYSDLVGLCIAYEPYAYDAKKKLFAPALIRDDKGLTPHMFESFYDYTKPERPGQPITRWYSVPIQQGAQWLEPYIEPITNSFVAVYSVPFFDVADPQKKKPSGVVTVMYPIAKVKEIVEDLGIGKTGYAFVISKSGYFLYHPVSDYVQKQKTIFEIADSLNNTTLRDVGDKAMHGKKGFADYLNEITSQVSSVYYEPLLGTGWSLGVTFIQEEAPISAATWRHYHIWILISVMVALLVLGFLLTKAYAGIHLWGYSTLCSLLLISGVFVLWALVYQAPSIEYVKGISVLDKVGLNTFLDNVNRRAASKHESLPITIPTGIYIRSLSFPSPMQVEITAEVWQQYDEKKHAGLEQGVIFPQAVNMHMEERYREKNGDVETVGWTVQGTLSQNFDYSRYPFDIKNIEISLDYKDKTKNVLLIPDFESYRLLSPVTKPGVDEHAKILGFTVRKSIFSFDTERTKVDFGIDETQASLTALNFNIALRRNLIDAMTVFLLPLLVILVALFAASWFTYEDSGVRGAYRSLAAYTAVVFALVLLHRAFREKLPSGEIIYLEYFFLFTYMTIVILILNALLLYSKIRLKTGALTFAYVIRFLFWPSEVLAWFITTVVIFYN